LKLTQYNLKYNSLRVFSIIIRSLAFLFADFFIGKGNFILLSLVVQFIPFISIFFGLEHQLINYDRIVSKKSIFSDSKNRAYLFLSIAIQIFIFVLIFLGLFFLYFEKLTIFFFIIFFTLIELYCNENVKIYYANTNISFYTLYLSVKVLIIPLTIFLFYFFQNFIPFDYFIFSIILSSILLLFFISFNFKSIFELNYKRNLKWFFLSLKKNINYIVATILGKFQLIISRYWLFFIFRENINLTVISLKLFYFFLLFDIVFDMLYWQYNYGKLIKRKFFDKSKYDTFFVFINILPIFILISYYLLQDYLFILQHIPGDFNIQKLDFTQFYFITLLSIFLISEVYFQNYSITINFYDNYQFLSLLFLFLLIVIWYIFGLNFFIIIVLHIVLFIKYLIVRNLNIKYYK